MAAVDATVSLRMLPGESVPGFAARVAAAHGPLSQSEVARLRAIFAPRMPVSADAPAPVRRMPLRPATAPPDMTAAPPVGTRDAA